MTCADSCLSKCKTTFTVDGLEAGRTCYLDCSRACFSGCVDSAVKSMSKGKKGAETTDMNADCNDPRSKCFTPEQMMVPLQHFESQLAKDKTFFSNLLQKHPVKDSKAKTEVVEAALKKMEKLDAAQTQKGEKYMSAEF